MLHLGQPPSQTGALMRRMLGHLDLWPADGDFTTKSVFIGSGSPRNGELCLSNHGQVGSGSGFAKTSHKAQYSAHAGRRGRTGGPAGVHMETSSYASSRCPARTQAPLVFRPQPVPDAQTRLAGVRHTCALRAPRFQLAQGSGPNSCI